jgi:hypothetical protein
MEAFRLEDIDSFEVLDNTEPVYDITVEDNHNYFLHTNSYPILVHNSGKSVFVSQKICMRFLTEDNHKFLVIRNTATSIKDSVYQELLNTLRDWGQLYRIQINKSEHRITLDNGNEIICKGLDDEQKIKSISGITGMWIEEATELKEDAFDQLNLRIRGDKDNYIQYILSFNPISEDHWLKRRFIDTDNPDVTFVHTTYKDNFFLDDEYKRVLEEYKQTNSLYYQVYCLGDWGIVDTSNKFLYAFDQEKHVKKCEYDKNLVVKLSFDFNIEPFAVQVYQCPDRETINFIDKVRLNDSDIYQVCDQIRAKYPNNHLIVTGDASGNNRTGTTRGKTSYWQIIKKELQLSNPQIKLRSKNIGLIESRVLCNSALQHKNINIDPSMKELIYDCKYSKVDQQGVLESKLKMIKDRNKNKQDDFDGFRYALDAEWPELIYRPKKR